MIITNELISIVNPEHSRTSCSDDDLSNSSGGFTGYYDKITGRKDIRYPRCNRCYLMTNIGEDTNSLEFDIIFSSELVWKDIQ